MALVAVAAAGCGGDSDKVKTFAVRGQVLVDGKPAERAVVEFHPQGGDERLQKLAPRGTTNKEGYYELGTYWLSDGVPVGEYKVTAVWRGPLPADAAREDFNFDSFDDQPDMLKGRYQDPAKTPLQITVQGAGELTPLELSTR